MQKDKCDFENLNKKQSERIQEQEHMLQDRINKLLAEKLELEKKNHRYGKSHV